MIICEPVKYDFCRAEQRREGGEEIWEKRENLKNTRLRKKEEHKRGRREERRKRENMAEGRKQRTWNRERREEKRGKSDQ